MEHVSATALVLVALISAIPSSIAAIAAVIGARRGTENRNSLTQVKAQTNGELERKIRTAVMEVFKDHRGEVTEAVMAESVRHLLDAMINPTQPYPRESEENGVH